jgi:hypothetical protein
MGIDMLAALRQRQTFESAHRLLRLPAPDSRDARQQHLCFGIFSPAAANQPINLPYNQAVIGAVQTTWNLRLKARTSKAARGFTKPDAQSSSRTNETYYAAALGKVDAE